MSGNNLDRLPSPQACVIARKAPLIKWQRRSSAVITAILVGTSLMAVPASAVELTYGVSDTYHLESANYTPGYGAYRPGYSVVPYVPEIAMETEYDDVEPQDVVAEVPADVETPEAMEEVTTVTLLQELTFAGVPAAFTGSLRGAPGVHKTGAGDVEFVMSGGNAAANNGAFLVTGGARRITGTMPDLGADVTFRVEVDFTNHVSTELRSLSLLTGYNGTNPTNGHSTTVARGTSASTAEVQTVSYEFAGGTPVTIWAEASVRINSIRIVQMGQVADETPEAPSFVETLWQGFTFAGVPAAFTGSLREAAGVFPEGASDLDFTITGGNASANNGSFLVSGGNRRLTTTLPNQGSDVTFRVEVEFTNHVSTDQRSVALITGYPGVGAPNATVLDRATSSSTTDVQTLSYEFAGGTEFSIWTEASVRINSIRVYHIDGGDMTVTTAPTDAVGNLAAAVGASGVEGLSWDEVADAADYLVAQGTVENIIGIATDTTFMVTSLTDGVPYVFFVTPRNEFGSGPSASIVATPVEVIMAVEAGAWREATYAVWQGSAGETYNVYVSPSGKDAWTLVNTPEHQPLVRLIDSSNLIWRADVPGLPELPGGYDLKVVANGTGVVEQVQGLHPRSFDRTGYAFSPQSRFGWTTGGYQADGSISDDAVVIYVTEQNMNTFPNPFNNQLGLGGLFPANGQAANRVGNQSQADTRPLIVRFIGQVGSGNRVEGQTAGVRPLPGYFLEGGGNIPAGLRGGDRMLNIHNTFNVTFEGVGPDATIFAWGLRVDQSQNIEIRNLTFDMFWDDGIMLAGGNQTQVHAFDTDGGAHNMWVHHNEFRHGQNRSHEETDLQFGDGALDHGDEATFFTISYNRFVRSDKTMLANGNNGRPFFRGSYHHNHFYNTQERHPRVRTGMAHIFNNFFEGTSSQGIQAGDFSNWNVPGLVESDLIL